MLGEALFDGTLLTLFALVPVVFVTLFFLSAPYGRHQRGGWGPGVPARLAWVLMELPTVPFFAWLVRGASTVALMLTALWMLHYVDRTFIYPFRIRPGSRPTPLAVVLMAFSFQTANVYVNATWLARSPQYTMAWLEDPRLIGGALLFVMGFVINRSADHALRRLRTPGETGYRVPHGGLYEWISCPNYFGELLSWVGWALATWSLAGLCFALFSAANLIPRAVSHHRWYRETFPDYPPARRAVLPYLL